LTAAWPKSASTRHQRQPLGHPPRRAAAQVDVLQKVWVLRKLLYGMDDIDAMEFLLDKIKATKNNGEFFDAMRR
jgi:hypothetical protein